MAVSKGTYDVTGVFVAVTVCRTNDARVDPGSVGLPYVEINVRDDIASVDVDDLDIKIDGDALLAFGNILADKFSVDD